MVPLIAMFVTKVLVIVRCYYIYIYIYIRTRLARHTLEGDRVNKQPGLRNRKLRLHRRRQLQLLPSEPEQAPRRDLWGGARELSNGVASERSGDGLGPELQPVS